MAYHREGRNTVRVDTDRLDERGKYTPELCDSLSAIYRRSLAINIGTILNGTTLVVDPSSSGATSLTAFALVERGVVTRVEEVPVPWRMRTRRTFVGQRINAMGQWLQEEFRNVEINLLVTELLYYLPQWNTNLESFQKMSMAHGAVHASINAQYRLSIPPWEWHSLRPPGYVKSDIGDVRLMADRVIADARIIG